MGSHKRRLRDLAIGIGSDERDDEMGVVDWSEEQVEIWLGVSSLSGYEVDSGSGTWYAAGVLGRWSEDLSRFENAARMRRIVLEE